MQIRGFEIASSEGTAVELLAQGAHFYELLGYALGVLSFVILLAGVAWSLRHHLSEKHRTPFVVVSFLFLGTLYIGLLTWLVFAQPFAVRLNKLRPLQRVDRTPAGEDVSDGFLSVELAVQPDGTVLFEGQELAAEHIVPHLQQEHPEKRLGRVTLRVDSKTPVVAVQPVVDHLHQHGLDLSIEPETRGESP